jgi:uncharacterized protein (TIGR03086 family)
LIDLGWNSLSQLDFSAHRFLSGSRQVYLADGELQRKGTPMRETELDRACQSNLGVLEKVTPQDLDAPTPCASWDVRALVNHFIGTARFWAAMMTGSDEPAAEDYAAGDLVAAYKASIGVATTAFEADGAMEKRVQLPFGEFPGAVVLGMAALDQFTHGWDLARALGLPTTDLDPALAGELLNQARRSIPDAFRGPDGQAPFGPAVAAPAGAGPADQLAAFLGRRV